MYAFSQRDCVGLACIIYPQVCPPMKTGSWWRSISFGALLKSIFYVNIHIFQVILVIIIHHVFVELLSYIMHSPVSSMQRKIRCGHLPSKNS